MLVRRFQWFENRSDFGPGWCPAWMDNGDPVAGFGAAHDTLEHFPRCIGGLEGELMAFGAMHVVRGEQSGYSWGRHHIYEAQHYDLAEFLGNVFWGTQTLKDPGPVDLDATKWLNIDELRLWMRKAVMSAINQHSTHGRGDTRASARRLLPPEPDERMVRWIAKGFIKARKRFNQWRCNPWDLGYLFGEITTEFDRLCKGGEEGDQLIVRVDFNQHHAWVERRHAYELQGRWS